jgi:hypothetical protein
VRPIVDGRWAWTAAQYGVEIEKGVAVTLGIKSSRASRARRYG